MSLCRSISLVATFAIRFQGTARIPLRRGVHGFGEGGRKISIKVNYPPDIVVELPYQTHISAQVVRDLGFMVLIYLINEKPILIQDILDLNKVLLKCLQDLAIYLGTIAKSWECVTLHGIFPFFGDRTLSNQNQSCMNNNHKERRKMRKNKRWDSAC